MLIEMGARAARTIESSIREHCCVAVLRYAVTWATGLIFVSCGFDDDPSLPPIQATLPRVQYRSDTDLSLCPRAPELVQRRIEVLESTLGIRGPAQVLYIHMFAREDALALGECGSRAMACARGNTIYAADYVDYHEIAHAVMSAVAPSPNVLITEGVAAAFGYSSDASLYPLKSWRELIDLPTGDPNYSFATSRGSRFVTRLFDDYGPDKLVALYKSASSTLSADEFATGFDAVYDVALDDVWSSLANMQYGVVCVALDDNTDLDGAENNPTPYCPGYVVPARHVWSLDADTPLAIESTYRQALLGSCDPSILPTDGGGLFNYAAGDPVFSIGPWQKGTYYATPSRVVGTESFRIWKGPWLGPNCAGITPYPLPFAPARFALGLPDQQWLALEWTGDAPLTYLAGVDWAYDDSTWYVCSACDRTQCQPVGDWVPQTIQPGVTWFFAEFGTKVRTENTWLYFEANN